MGKLRDVKLQAAAIVVAAVILVFGWMNRYEPVPGSGGPWVLDRLKGRLCTVRYGEMECFTRKPQAPASVVVPRSETATRDSALLGRIRERRRKLDGVP